MADDGDSEIGDATEEIQNYKDTAVSRNNVTPINKFEHVESPTGTDIPEVVAQEVSIKYRYRAANLNVNLLNINKLL